MNFYARTSLFILLLLSTNLVSCGQQEEPATEKSPANSVNQPVENTDDNANADTMPTDEAPAETEEAEETEEEEEQSTHFPDDDENEPMPTDDEN